MTASPRIYLAESATASVARQRGEPSTYGWFIVEPRADDPQRLAQQVRRLLRADRRVLRVLLHPRGSEVMELTGLPDGMLDITLRIEEGAGES